ncbi:TerC family protein [Egicoccus sp. AB-alg2]|uniref:TerC family protein n=1 Tax=Egicoccus sp. AB-alg2 TaxID=3242693 RepID=UPI00359E3591
MALHALVSTAAETAGPGRFVSIDVPVWAWLALVAVIVALLLADLLLVHRVPHEIPLREAFVESGVWIAIGLVFGLVVARAVGWQAAGEYFGGYLIEKSLSIDNVFVWAVIFSFFAVPNRYQFRVLFWGVFGALVLRAVFIFAGVALLDRFDWLLYVFGALLIYTAYRMLRAAGKEVDPDRNPALRAVRRFLPVSKELDGQKLFTRRDGVLMATPLFAVLVLIEFTDVVFAVDSVPAILAVSREPFIVFSANAFAILGLRALYFALAGMHGRFRYLDRGLAAILTFVGVKMLLVEVYHVPIYVSLGVIAAILGVAIVTSLRAEELEHEEPQLLSTAFIGRPKRQPAAGERRRPDRDDDARTR